MKLTLDAIENRIHTIRGVHVLMDSDLALMYQVETRVLNQAVKRNINRFPDGFCFQLTEEETKDMRSQFVTSKLGRGGTRFLPFVFTELGVAMLSAVLRSNVAVMVSIKIMQAFVAMRKTICSFEKVIQRLDSLENKQIRTDISLEKILCALEKDKEPMQGIFFEGELFDAHVWICSLIRQAKVNIALIDNYADESTLLLLSKRKKGVTCRIYSKPRSSLLRDLEKHNRQYPIIDFVPNSSSHDRFLVIDHERLFHIGASLKDLGLKCFAFSKMDSLLPEIQRKLLKA